MTAGWELPPRKWTVHWWQNVFCTEAISLKRPRKTPIAQISKSSLCHNPEEDLDCAQAVTKYVTKKVDLLFLRSCRPNGYQERNEKSPSKQVFKESVALAVAGGQDNSKRSLCLVLFIPRLQSPYVSQTDWNLFPFSLLPDCLDIGWHFKSYTFSFFSYFPFLPVLGTTSEEWFSGILQWSSDTCLVGRSHTHRHRPSRKNRPSAWTSGGRRDL